MSITPRLRKLLFTVHITASLGWLGAVIAYLALATTGLTNSEARIVHTYLSMELIGWYVIVPLCLAALSTGVIQALATPWGLFRHYWVATKLLLTAVATAILLKHMPTVSRMADLVKDGKLPGSDSDFGILPTQLLIHAGGGLLVLLVITAISVYKPWGMTHYGQRKNEKHSSLRN